MLVECLVQTDVMLEGPGHRAFRTRALFVGQRYDLPEEAVAQAIAAGRLRAVLADSPPVEQPARAVQEQREKPAAGPRRKGGS